MSRIPGLGCQIRPGPIAIGKFQRRTGSAAQPCIQTDTLTYIQIHSPTDRQTYSRTETLTYIQTHSHTGRQTESHTETLTLTSTQRCDSSLECSALVKCRVYAVPIP